MFVEGKIKSYITDRGFGFISIAGETKDLFFHIRDLPNKNVEPKIGEQLKFQIVEDNGKLKAEHIIRLDLKPDTLRYSDAPASTRLSRNASPRFNERSRKGLVFTVLGCVVIAILAMLVYQKYQHYRQTQHLKTQQLMEQQAHIVDQQRKALGDLPDRVLSKQAEQRLNLPDSSSFNNNVVPATRSSVAQVSAQFKCDGRQHCSQMGSYEEAVFFLRNCPNTKMDGNNDGQPCEKQFSRR